MKIVMTTILLLAGLFSTAQLNMTLKSQIDSDGNGNDIWGYVAPDGTEYAVLGTTIGTRVYSLEDTENPIERIFIPGSNSTWRDMKQWGEYVYVTCDSGDDGLLIIDMTQAPDNIDFKFLKPVVDEGELSLDRCHNIYIDENGIIYLAGCQGRGVEFFDPNTDPLDPEYLGSIPSPYAHDAYAKGDTLYASQIFGGDLALYDVSDKTNPILLGSVETSSDFTHNAWGDPTNTYAFTTDERAEGFVDAYDISDPTNIEFLDKFQPPGTAGTATIPHNTHYFNGFLVTSWYTSGVVIIDGNKPDNLIQVGYYDTFDGPNGGFQGCWGVTPYLPSGTLIASDINSGLWVFDVDYVRACYLEGKITDKNTGASISNANINLISSDLKDPASSMANGEYKTGQATAGTFTVEYTHPLYFPVTLEVELINGEVTIQDVEMESLPTYDVNFLTVTDTDGNPLQNSQIFVRGESINYSFKTDENGAAAGSVVAGQYDIFAGNWGYHNVVLSNSDIQANENYTLELPEGYMDDFIVDLGWQVENIEETNDFTGAWERAVPAGTFGNGMIFNPDQDVTGDLGNMAYVTDNEVGGSSFSSDVDDGITILRSPEMDLTSYDNPQVQFRLWFATGSGNGQFDDEITVRLSNGAEDVDILVYNNSQEFWSDMFSFNVAEALAITNTMTIEVAVGDSDANGHIVEAGFDQFFVTGAPTVNTTEIALEGIDIYPSPANSQFTIDSEQSSIQQYEIINATGQIVASETINTKQKVIDIQQLAAGAYFVRIYTDSKEQGTYPLQIIR